MWDCAHACAKPSKAFWDCISGWFSVLLFNVFCGGANCTFFLTNHDVKPLTSSLAVTLYLSDSFTQNWIGIIWDDFIWHVHKSHTQRFCLLPVSRFNNSTRGVWHIILLSTYVSNPQLNAVVYKVSYLVLLDSPPDSVPPPSSLLLFSQYVADRRAHLSTCTPTQTACVHRYLHAHGNAQRQALHMYTHLQIRPSLIRVHIDQHTLPSLDRVAGNAS